VSSDAKARGFLQVFRRRGYDLTMMLVPRTQQRHDGAGIEHYAAASTGGHGTLSSLAAPAR
jgi:hypothetical protein